VPGVGGYTLTFLMESRLPAAPEPETSYVIPRPAGLVLLGSGLAALAALRRRRRRRSGDRPAPRRGPRRHTAAYKHSFADELFATDL